MLIGIDICNTIANINYELIQRFPEFNIKQYPCPGIPKDYFSSPEGLQLFLKARPFYRAAESLHQIKSAGNGLIYITSRPQVAEFVTQRWLKLHGFPKATVKFLASQDKALFASEVGIKVFFEDDPTVISELLENGIEHIVVKNTPYNRHIREPNITRFNEWGQLNSSKPLYRVRL